MRAAAPPQHPAATVRTPPPSLPLSFAPNHGQAAVEIDFIARASGVRIALSATTATTTARGSTVAMQLSGARPGAELAESGALPGRMSTAGAFQTAPGGGVSDANGDAYVTKLAPYGRTLIWSTYIGGSGFDDAGGIAADRAGHVFVRGVTNSPDFPTTPGAFQTQQAGPSFNVWVAELAADGSSLVYSTYLGGHGFNSGTGLAIDGSGAAYVTGVTGAADFPTTPDALDTNFQGTANFAPPPFSTRPDDYDVTGRTASADFPTTRSAFQTRFASTLAPPQQPCTPIRPPPCGPRNAYVSKLSRDGSRLLYSTYIGGSVFDFGQSIAVDSDGRAYISGGTFSPNFPTTSGAPQTTIGGNQDAIVSVLSPDGSSLVMSTFLGGTDFDQGVGLAMPAARTST